MNRKDTSHLNKAVAEKTLDSYLSRPSSKMMVVVTCKRQLLLHHCFLKEDQGCFYRPHIQFYCGVDLHSKFRRQLKARKMAYGMPIQIVREPILHLADENKYR